MYNFTYKGVRIVAHCYTRPEQARKHRKKRINKKWLKRYGYKQVPDLSIMHIVNIPGQGKTIFCHPKLAEKLKVQIMKMEGFL